MDAIQKISRELEALGGLQECLLTGVEWLHRGAVIELSFAYFLEDVDGEIRPTEQGLASPGDVIVRASWVLAMSLDNSPTRDMFDKTASTLPWGFSEVASVDVEMDVYRSQWLDQVDCVRVNVRWEDQHRITIWCQSVNVTVVRAAGLA